MICIEMARYLPRHMVLVNWFKGRSKILLFDLYAEIVIIQRKNNPE